MKYSLYLLKVHLLPSNFTTYHVIVHCVLVFFYFDWQDVPGKDSGGACEVCSISPVAFGLNEHCG